MDSIYTLKGLIDISALPVVAGNSYFMPQTKQVADYRYATGSMSQSPIERGK